MSREIAGKMYLNDVDRARMLGRFANDNESGYTRHELAFININATELFDNKSSKTQENIELRIMAFAKYLRSLLMKDDSGPYSRLIPA
jgi:hypothetical protein